MLGHGSEQSSRDPRARAKFVALPGPHGPPSVRNACSPESPTPAHDPTLDAAWRRIRDELRDAVGAQAFDIWLAPVRAVALNDTTLVLEAPDAMRSWIADRFARVLQACTAAVLGPEATVDLVTASASDPRPRPQHPPSGGPAADRTPLADIDDRFNPKLNFDQFVIGASNQLAHAAALAVSELPGQAYNPLFLYGPPGVGKTHLLHAIGNYIRSYGGGLTVRYTTTERFTGDFVAALRTGRVDDFKGRFRRADVLLVDDVQFLVSKARTEEEFFHTFNALHDAGAQIVVTSDRLPHDLDELEDRLRERFEAGLVCEIARPDHGVRLAVLRKRVQHDAIELADPRALTVIADRITDNVRALEGALIRVVAYHSLTGRPIDVDLAHEVLDGLYPESRRPTPGAGGTPTPLALVPGVPPTVEQIQDATCELFGLSREQLISASRAANVAWPRQVAMYLSREHTAESLPSIGRSFGGRNHTTVMHACKRASERIATDPEAYETVRTLTERLCTAPS
ncbi:MAG: chromosomal replication initiator protein DnaA [Solirubrobacteraceae bacterium]|nr:chromosomal replication initiator protein DnaA [Solirubrobacteraceae bacterium]